MHPIVKKIVTEKSIKESINRSSIYHNNKPTNLKENIIKYVCVEGDRIGLLALKYQTTTTAIQILNRLPPSRQEFYPGEIILIIPQYLTSDTEALQSLVLNLSIEEKIEKYASVVSSSNINGNKSNETLSNIFGNQNVSLVGYSNWGDEGIGFVHEKDIEFFMSKQEKYASKSTVPYSIRCYLRIKAGFMKESTCFRKYTKVWCVLVDQHLLIFENILDQNPKRIIYLYGDCWKTTRTATTLCIAFEVDPYSTGNTAKIFYKIDEEQDCKDWYELFQLISHHSIGTSIKDLTHLNFGDYFRDITINEDPNIKSLQNEYQHQNQNENEKVSKRQLEWNWMINNGDTKGMKCLGDSFCDNLIDGLWDIDDGRIVHEENSEMLRVILIRCHHMIEEDKENNLTNIHQHLSYCDNRIKQFLEHIYTPPTWIKFNLLKNGSLILLTRISWIFTTYLDYTIPEILSSLEGISIFASITSIYNILLKDPKVPNQINYLEQISVSNNVIEYVIKRIFNLIFRSFIAASTNCLKSSTDIWDDLLEFRIELSILRRKILSIFGIGRWDEKRFGLPFNQQFLGYCIGLFALHSINLIKSLQFGNIHEDDTNSILHLWAYIGYLIGIHDNYNPCLDNYNDFLTHISIERNERLNKILLKQNQNDKTTVLNNTIFNSSNSQIVIINNLDYIQKIILQIHSISSSFPTFNLRIISSNNNNNNNNNNWNQTYHLNYTIFCYYFGKLSNYSNICPNEYFSYSLFFYFIFLFLYFNIYYYFTLSSFNSHITNSNHSNQLIINNSNNNYNLKNNERNIDIFHKLETYLNIVVNDEVTTLEDKISMRLWHDDETRKKISSE